MHPALVTGLVLDALLVPAGWLCSPVVGAVMAAAWILSAAGLVLIARTRYVMGQRLVRLGAIAFLPLGLIAVWGARSTIDRAIERIYRVRLGIRSANGHRRRPLVGDNNRR